MGSLPVRELEPELDVEDEDGGLTEDQLVRLLTGEMPEEEQKALWRQQLDADPALAGGFALYVQAFGDQSPGELSFQELMRTRR
jgi:hypothetical protein